MNIFLIGLVLIALMVDCYSLKQIKDGLTATKDSDDELGWVGWNLILCLFIGGFCVVVLYFTGFTINDVDGVPSPLGDTLGLCFIVGAFIWCVNMVIFALIVNCCLEGYISYRQGCLRLGVDLKEHVDKFFVTTHKTFHGVQEYDGLRADIGVRLNKIMYSKSWLGTHPYMKHVATLVVLPEVKLQKEIISEYVQDYFNARGQYLVEGTELKVLDSKPLDVIIVK